MHYICVLVVPICSCWILPSIVISEKFRIVTRFVNRVTIFVAVSMVFLGVQSWHDFSHAWHVFRIRLVVPWVVRINRDTILTVADCYIVFLFRFWIRAWSESNLDYKGGNFRVECLCSEVLLGWETLLTPWVVRFHHWKDQSFLLCFLLGFIVSVGDMKMGRN